MNIEQIIYILDDATGERLSIVATIDGDDISIPIVPENRHYQAVIAAEAEGVPVIERPLARPPIVRTCTLNQWMTALAGAGHYDMWAALANDTTVKAVDRSYSIRGGDAGVMSERSSRMARLGAKTGIDIAAIFDAALAG